LKSFEAFEVTAEFDGGLGGKSSRQEAETQTEPEPERPIATNQFHGKQRYFTRTL
jgi:hypothetical protein